ncbi:UNVERIFIED_ORG: hypothetical protein FHW05_002219 [Pantoea agglomerans]
MNELNKNENKLSISERMKHVRIEQGHCLIFGQFGKLSKDHVPLKSAIDLPPVLDTRLS